MKNHPGLLYGFIFPSLFAMAAFNTSRNWNNSDFQFAIASIVGISLLMWMCILITAWDQRDQYEDK